MCYKRIEFENLTIGYKATKHTWFFACDAPHLNERSGDQNYWFIFNWTSHKGVYIRGKPQYFDTHGSMMDTVRVLMKHTCAAEATVTFWTRRSDSHPQTKAYALLEPNASPFTTTRTKLKTKYSVCVYYNDELCGRHIGCSVIDATNEAWFNAYHWLCAYQFKQQALAQAFEASLDSPLDTVHNLISFDTVDALEEFHKQNE